MSAKAVGQVAGNVASSIIGDVRYIVATAIGIGVGTWLGRYWWMKWERGLMRAPFIGSNPDFRNRAPIVALPPSSAGQPLPPPPGKSLVGAVAAPAAPSLWAGRPAPEES